MRASKAKLSQRLSKTTEPLNYETTLRIIRDAALAVRPAPVLVAEGANTMDNARCAFWPRRRSLQWASLSEDVGLFYFPRASFLEGL